MEKIKVSAKVSWLNHKQTDGHWTPPMMFRSQKTEKKLGL